MRIGGRLVDLKRVRVPLLHIGAQYDHIVPQACSMPLMQRVGSTDKEEIILPGGHVSLIAGANAVKRMWPRAFRQRCQVHKMRNILAKLPRAMQGQMKRLIHQVFRASSHAQALKRGRALIAQFRDRYSAAMECLERDLEECVTYLLSRPTRFGTLDK